MEEFFENELAKRFEQMIENQEEYYFDSSELEEIIIHYLELGDISYAELSVNYGLKLHPTSMEIKTKKLEVLLELEDYPTAKQLIEELQPSLMENVDFLVCCAKYYSNLGNPKRAIEYCHTALKISDEEQNFINNFIADEYVNLGDPFKALDYYKNALNADPQDDYALENIMLCYSELKKNNEALTFLNNYLDDFPFSEIAWQEYAQFHYNRKNYKEAIKGFDYILAINPASIGAYSNKAACYEAMEKYQEAINVYEELLELEYTKAYTYYRIGLCYKELKKWGHALIAFKKSLVEDPQFDMAMMEQSFVYQEMGNTPEALHFAEDAAILNNTNVEYQKRLAFLYVDSGRFEESLVCLKKLVDNEPSVFYNWYALVETLFLLDRYSEAVEFLEKALMKHQRAELYFQLSNCYYNLNEDKKGFQALATAMELDASLAEDMQKRYPYIKDKVSKVKSKKK